MLKYRSQEDIHSLLSASKWKEAMNVLTEDPHLASYEKDGVLPLHLALSLDAPLDLIQVIIDAYPDGCKAHVIIKTNFPLILAIHWKKHDNTPETRREKETLIKRVFNEAPEMGTRLGEGKATILHSILEHQPSVDIVQYLIRRVEGLPGKQKKLLYKEKDEEKQLPLHVAIEYHCSDEVIGFLLEKYPKAIFVGRVEKVTPLHLALIRGCSLRALEILLDKQGYKALWSRDEDGNTPLHLWFERQRIQDNKNRMAQVKSRQYEISSDEEVFEFILEKLSLTEAQNLLSTVNELKLDMIAAAKDIQHVIHYPRSILRRMQNIMETDKHEVDTDDEKSL